MTSQVRGLTLRAINLELRKEFYVFELHKDSEDFEPTLERERLLGPLA